MIKKDRRNSEILSDPSENSDRIRRTQTEPVAKRSSTIYSSNKIRTNKILAKQSISTRKEVYLRILPWWIKKATQTTDFEESIYSYRELQLLNYWAGVYSMMFVKDRVSTKLNRTCTSEVRIYTAYHLKEYKEVSKNDPLYISNSIPDDFELKSGQNLAMVMNFQPIFGAPVKKTSLENLEVSDNNKNSVALQKSLILILSTKNGKRVLEIFGYNIKLASEGELKKFGGLSENSIKRDVHDFNVRLNLVQKLVLQELGIQHVNKKDVLGKLNNPNLIDFKKYPLAHKHKDQYQKFIEQQGEQRKIYAKRESENDVCQDEIIYRLTVNCFNSWYWGLLKYARSNPLKYWLKSFQYIKQVHSANHLVTESLGRLWISWKTCKGSHATPDQINFLRQYSRMRNCNVGILNLPCEKNFPRHFKRLERIQHRNLEDHRASVQETQSPHFNFGHEIPRSKTLNYSEINIEQTTPSRSGSKTFKKRPKDIPLESDSPSKVFEEKLIPKIFDHIPELWHGPWSKMLFECEELNSIVSPKFKRVQLHKPNDQSNSGRNNYILNKKHTAFYQITHNGGICLLEVNFVNKNNSKKCNQDTKFKLIFTIYSLKYIRMQTFDEFVRHQHLGRMITTKELIKERGSYEQQMIDMREFNSVGVMISNYLLVQTCIKDIEFEILCDSLRFKFENKKKDQRNKCSLNIFPNDFNYCGFLKNYLTRIAISKNDGK